MTTTLLMTGLTDPGRVRPGNEDYIATRPEIGLAVLADGMGGHQAGEVASEMAVEVITRHFEDIFTKREQDPRYGRTDVAPGEPLEVHAVSEAIQRANAAIYEVAQMRTDYSGMGSTIVVALFYGDKVCVAHVGDSRFYRFREGRLEQITQDHSVVQELMSRGLMTAEEARTTIGKNLVTRALGVDPVVIPDVTQETLRDADTYLLCSDGLNDMLGDQEIGRILAENTTDLEEAAHRLVSLANERGGPDNISVILARANANDQATDERTGTKTA